MKTPVSLLGYTYSKSDLYGNSEGIAFDDLDAFKKQIYLPSAVNIWPGDVIDAVEFVYSKQYENKTSPFFHGGPNGYFTSFDLVPGEVIRKIRGYYAVYHDSTDPTQRKTVIIKLQFETNLGRKSPEYGNACGKPMPSDAKEFTFDAGVDGVICALFGRTGKSNLELHGYVRGIGVYVLQTAGIASFLKSLLPE